MRLIVASLLLAHAAACSPAPAPTATPSVAQDATASASASASPPPSCSPEPAAWLPPWAGPATTTAVIARSELPFCGVEEGGFAG